MRNNPELKYLPNFLWNMSNLKEIIIDGSLISGIPHNIFINNILRIEPLFCDKINSIIQFITNGKKRLPLTDQQIYVTIGTFHIFIEKRNTLMYKKRNIEEDRSKKEKKKQKV